jgi:hypothetical protein
MSIDEFWRYFHEIYEAIPRQGPGDRESTGRALCALPPLTHGQRITAQVGDNPPVEMQEFIGDGTNTETAGRRQCRSVESQSLL